MKKLVCKPLNENSIFKSFSFIIVLDKQHFVQFPVYTELQEIEKYYFNIKKLQKINASESFFQRLWKLNSQFLNRDFLKET